MEVQAPSPQTTLLILLGASAWPFMPEFQHSEAFANAARRLKAYFLNPRPFGLPAENLLDLFDSEKSADELDVAIGQFLAQHLATMKARGNAARDLLLYFIGHGGFVGRDSDFYLAIRRTRMENPRTSGLPVLSLADTLTNGARYLRRIIVLDCCFAAAAFSAFQAGPDQVALEKTRDAFQVGHKAVGFPAKGTTLLCSSNHKSPSLLLPDGSSTMFTQAFLDALVQGAPSQRDRLTLRDVKDAATDLLSEIRNAPKPVVHSPDQSEGDVADIPFFPNPWIEEERLRRAAEERRRQAEEEQTRKEEEERLRTATQSVEPHVAATSSPPALVLPPVTTESEPYVPQMSKRRLSRRTVVVGLTGLAVAGSGLTWLALTQRPEVTSPAPQISVGPIDMQTLISNAKKEGQLQAIGIPPEWVNYKDILNGYTTHYSIPIAYQAEAEYSSAQELEVFKNSIQHPHGDIADVGYKFGNIAVEQGLVTPYKHAYWDDIFAHLKDPLGNWCTEYWGTQAFLINTDKVKSPPTSFQDLLTNDYKNMVGIDGDPRQANDAFIAVYSAALANGGSFDNIQPGIDFFAKLKKNGNFTPARSSIANIGKGEVAIGIMWDYLAQGFRDQLAGNPQLKVIIPTDGSIAGPYISIINKTAPHPFAARLWIEYIFSDEGQLLFLKGYAHPARYQALVAANAIPADLASKLLPAEQYGNVKFVTDINQITKASAVVSQNWGSQVLGQ